MNLRSVTAYVLPDRTVGEDAAGRRHYTSDLYPDIAMCGEDLVRVIVPQEREPICGACHHLTRCKGCDNINVHGVSHE